MKLNYRKPAVAVAIVGGVLAVSGTAAFAYWTATGTGSGTAAAGDSLPLTISQVPFNGNALTPGGAAQAISGSVANPNTFNVPYSLSTKVTTDKANCDTSWYTVTLTNPTGNVPAATSTGNGTSAFAGTIAMTNVSNVNQDACKNAVVTITYTAASS